MASGGADFCLTSVNHYLRARAQSGELPARFVSVVVRRSPMAGLVAASSHYATKDHLAGTRVGGDTDNSMVKEYAAALSFLGLDPPVPVPMDYAAAPSALASGEIDAVADFADLVPRVRRQSGIPVRAVPFGLPFYSSGLVAADRVPTETVLRMQTAVAAALGRQRQDPRTGLDELAHRYPEADPVDAVEGWLLAEPNIFTDDGPVGTSEPERWRATIAYAAGVHALPSPRPETVYRPEVIGLSAVH